MKRKNFPFDLMKEENVDFLYTTNSIDLWHKRLEKLAECAACQFGKQIKKAIFPESSWRQAKSSNMFTLILSDCKELHH
ncbi:hypothetical protein CR513_44764, partial [Mucuna pruriens]